MTWTSTDIQSVSIERPGVRHRWALALIAPLASLKLTVSLFAMSIFLIFAGTLAQVDRGIWTVMDEYFRTFVAWIDLAIFFPRSWSVPRVAFPFPGGWLIGGLLLANLVVAHAMVFKIKATGQRLVIGTALCIAGIVLTGMVLAGFFQAEIAATESAAFWRVLLRLIQG